MYINIMKLIILYTVYCIMFSLDAVFHAQSHSRLRSGSVFYILTVEEAREMGSDSIRVGNPHGE